MGNKNTDEKIVFNVVQFIFAIIFLVMILFSFIGCSTPKYVPVQTVEKIEYKDTTIFIHDTIKVDIPHETIKQIVPQDTISILSTNLAHSEAKITKGILYHSLEQKGSVKVKYDTIVKVQYVDKIIEKEIPVEVIKEVKHIAQWCWWSLIFNIVIILLIGFRIYLRFRGVS
jgi:hypothetical protein